MKEIKFATIGLRSDVIFSLQAMTISQILIFVIVNISLFSLIRFHWKRRRMYAMAAKIPGPPCYPIIGNAYLFVGSTENILKSVSNLYNTYTTPIKVWLGHYLFFAVYTPEHLEIIFNHPKAIGKDDLYQVLYPAVGHGLFSAPVEKWKKNRKIISPTFNQRILNDFVAVFSEQSVIFANILQSHVNKMFDMKHLTDRFTLDVVCETTMGIKINEQSTDSDMGECIETICHLAFQRMFQIWYHPDIIFDNFPIGRKFKKCVKKFRTFTNQVVLEKKTAYYKQKQWAEECPEAETDELRKIKSFLDLLLELTEESGTFTNDELSDEVNTILIAVIITFAKLAFLGKVNGPVGAGLEFAKREMELNTWETLLKLIPIQILQNRAHYGSDTSATVICFALVMLGMHPDLQEKLYAEAIDVIGLDRNVESTDLPNLKLLDRFLQETNRLFPIGPLVVRAHEQDIQLAGSSSVLCILQTHRSEKYWPNPLKFDPDRFLPENVAKRHPYAYIPFTAGPRICIGKKYGMMLLKTVMAHLIRKFKFSTSYKNVEDIKLRQNLLLRPVDGYPLQLELRE